MTDKNQGSAADRLNLTKANKPNIMDTNGQPINNAYGKDGDHTIFVNGASAQYGVKINGSWHVMPMSKI